MNMRIGIGHPLDQYADAWRRIIDARPPDVLYHYTDFAGVIGITQSRQLWMSKAHYLNDYSEVHFFFERMRAILKMLPDFGMQSGVIETALGAIPGLGIPETQPFYVCCFCEDGDLLSQWRGYTDSAIGVSVGFRSMGLVALAQAQGLHIGRCFYDESEQDAIAISLVLDLARGIQNQQENAATEVAVQNFQERLTLAALVCKNPKFSEEREWRLVRTNENVAKENFGVRARRARLVPFYRLDLPPWTRKGIVEGCYIGPMAKFWEVEEGLRKLIANSLCQAFAIRESGIPYRA